MTRPRITVLPVLFLAPLAAQDGNQQQKWFEKMDFGPAHALTVEHAGFEGNDSLKAQVVKLADGSGAVFDTELLRLSAYWLGGEGSLRLRGTPFDGAHGPMTTVRGKAVATSPVAPGWGSPDGSMDDPRAIPHGPMARSHGRFLGHYLHGRDVVLHYQVQGREIHEAYSVEGEGAQRLFVRTMRVAPSPSSQRFVLAGRANASTQSVSFREDGRPGMATVNYTAERDGETQERALHATYRGVGGARFEGVETRNDDGNGMVIVELPASDAVQVYKVFYADAPASADMTWVDAVLEASPAPADLAAWTKGGETLWGEVLEAEGVRGSDDDGPYAVDWIAHPESNPWDANMRLCAFDFFADGRAAVTTWNGDVWVVSGIDDDLQALRWKRYATGLYDPLGLKIVDDVVYVHGRDQLTRLHDQDGNGEADHYECFNNDVQITKAFHEFAFDLQTDKAGNFYFSKGGPVNPGGRGFMKIVPHHGTVMRVSPDGAEFEVVVHGLRAPNGIGVGPDGQITTGDNEGTWVPRCRLNYVTEPGFFAGVMDMRAEGSDAEIYDLPICWMPMEIDNSSGGQVWNTSANWGGHRGGLMHLSYGTCSLYRVLFEEVEGHVQGGVVRYPVNFRSSAMRARFHPGDGQLYLCGFRGWQTTAATEAAFHRIRHTEKPCYMPDAFQSTADGVVLRFEEALDAEVAADPESWSVEVWNYAWTKEYGSPEVSVSDPDEKAKRGEKNRDELAVRDVAVSADGKTVTLKIEGMQPVMQMRIGWNMDAADGELVKGEMHLSIHNLRKGNGSGDE